MSLLPINLAVPGGNTLAEAFASLNDAYWNIIPITAVGWNAAHTWGSGQITQTIWSNGVYRVKAVYTYTGENLTSVVYSYSTNSGGNYTTLGTNTLGYTGSDLTSETWS